jgi:hypothetical protein
VRFTLAGYQLCASPGAYWAIDKPQVSAYISAPRVRRTHLAQVAELVDALVSGTSGAIRGGSSPLLGTISQPETGVNRLRGCTGSAGLLAVSPPYSGRGQEFLVGDPYQIAPFVLGNIESGIRTCNEFVKRTDLHVT